MLKSLFTINLNQKILPGKVTFGKFDGQYCSMVATLSDDKILIHQPYTSTESLSSNSVFNSKINDTNILNINQKINGLCCGKFNSENDNEVIVVGTQTSLIVFDIHNNKELFFKNISDGSNAVALGEIDNQIVALSGGNCAIQGFDFKGEDAYWTVTGNNVTCIDICDLNKDGQSGILMGSDGNEICYFKNENLVFDLQETDKIKFICFLEANYFAYALNNGTVGVYNNKERIWRIKSKKEIVAIKAWDVNNDGINELITGWSSGKVDVRDIKTGQVLHKEVFKDPIAGIFVCDYNMDRKDELVIVTVTGELIGYETTYKKEKKFDQTEIKKFEQEKIREMLMLKNNLLLELRNYENNNKLYKDQINNKQKTKEFTDSEESEYGAIPANTQLKSSLSINKNFEDLKDACIELGLKTTNETIIRAAIIFAEGIFNGESYIAHPSDLEVSNDITIQIKPERNVLVDLHVKAIVGYHKSDHYHVFELSRTIPKFSMFAVNSFTEKELIGKATYSIDIKANKLISWINKNFLVDEKNCFTTENQKLTLNLQCLKTSNFCIIELNENENQLLIQCDSMQIAGELIQSIISESKMNQNFDLNCVLNFPKEIEQLHNLVEQVNNLESVHQQLNTDFADNSSIIKQLLIKAEDARLLDEFKLMKQYYGELNSMNKNIINDFQIRNQNKQELISCLKNINIIIQQAANLRIGSYKNQIIQTCREAIKNNNLNLISRIIVTGEN